MTSKNWVTDPNSGHHHLDGIPWHHAPRPPRVHFCRPWSIGTGSYGTVYRCPCGALRLQGSRRWVEKNSCRRETR